MASWTTEPLEDCLEALIDYRGKSPTKSASGIPVLSAKVVKTTGLLRPIEQTIAPHYYPKWMTRGYPKPGDVVMTTEAPLGEVIQLDEETASFALGQRIVCLRGRPGKMDNTFLRYLLTSPMQQEVLDSRATGTTVLGISQKALRSMPVSFPQISEQREIGMLLSSLDDKIELNRKMNATLEAMARALFRDWFVDFGPTRAKMEGRAPYLSPDLWSLFPDRLDAEGKPEGWVSVSFGSLLESSIGGDWGGGVADSKHTIEVAIVRGTDIPDLLNGGPNRVPHRFVEPKKLEKRRLMPGDIVIEVSGGSPTQPTGRSLYFTQALLDRFSVPVIPTSFCRRFRPKSIDVGLILTQHLQDLYAEGGTWGYQNQSTGIANFQTSHFLEAEKVVVPSTAVMRAFSDFCMPIMERMQSNENHFLAQTRDLLLPRLMSGELRVAEAERLVGEVV